MMFEGCKDSDSTHFQGPLLSFFYSNLLLLLFYSFTSPTFISFLVTSLEFLAGQVAAGEDELPDFGPSDIFL